MIVRKSRINPKAQDVQFAVSYGLPDVRKWVRQYIDAVTMGDGDFLAKMRSASISEVDMRHWLERNPHALGWVEKPWREQLSAWAFSMMVRNAFLFPSAANPDAYLFTDAAFVKIGRPIGS